MFGSSSNTFDPNKDIPDLSGKVYVVTGGSAGIGFGICAHLLQHNCERLYLLGKKEEHIAEAEEALKKYGDISRVISIQIELEDLHNVDEVAKRLASELTRLDALILNAGLGVGVYNETKDGVDSHMQVNVFSQHHLMMMLLPILIKTLNSRVVMQSSEMHRIGTSKVEFRSIEEINTDIGAMPLYGRTKLAQLLLTQGLVRRKAKGQFGLQPDLAPWFLATHPGGVVTGQQDQAVEAYGTMGKLGVKAVQPFMKDATDEGCRPVLFAATSGDVVTEHLDGAYIVPDRKATAMSTQGVDEKMQERCFMLTEEFLQENLGKLPYSTTYV